jgi:hypothetical protein
LRTFSPLAFTRRFHVIFFFLVMLFLRIACALRWRVDSDEPQHLHVIWGWVTGHVQYRDVFDNHGPVFHLLFAPLFYFLGERADILIPMRLAMLPLFAVSLWCIYTIGTSLFSKQVGLWSAILTGFYPEFFLTSAEFRTDVLWTALWLLTLVVVTRHPFGSKHAFAAGLLLGAAFGVTVKTGLMLGALFPWWMLNGIRLWREGGQGAMRQFFGRTFLGLVGFAIVPGVVTLFFVTRGMGNEFFYCNVGHNLVPHSQNWSRFDAHVLWLPLFLLLLAGVYPFVKARRFTDVEMQRIAIVLTAGFYFTALKTLFPTLTRQDDLPVIPLLVLIVVSLPFVFVRHPRFQSLLPWSLPILAVIEIFGITLKTVYWRDDTSSQRAMLADVLRATDKNDFVMDAVGETIFRMRPYYYALEAFTKVRIERGLIQDEIAQRLIKTQTELVRPKELTATAQAFIRENYLAIGNGLWMPGKELKSSKPASPNVIRFETAIPTRYAILNANGEKMVGQLDDVPFSGERFLDSGQHQFVGEANRIGSLLLFSARGSQRGFLPLRAHKP